MKPMRNEIRPSVNNAKDLLDHFPLFPCDVHMLVWSGLQKLFYLYGFDLWDTTTIFLCEATFAWRRQTNKQQGDPSASLLLRRQSLAESPENLMEVLGAQDAGQKSLTDKSFLLQYSF